MMRTARFSARLGVGGVCPGMSAWEGGVHPTCEQNHRQV